MTRDQENRFIFAFLSWQIKILCWF